MFTFELKTRSISSFSSPRNKRKSLKWKDKAFGGTAKFLGGCYNVKLHSFTSSTPIWGKKFRKTLAHKQKWRMLLIYSSSDTEPEVPAEELLLSTAQPSMESLKRPQKRMKIENRRNIWNECDSWILDSPTPLLCSTKTLFHKDTRDSFPGENEPHWTQNQQAQQRVCWGWAEEIKGTKRWMVRCSSSSSDWILAFPSQWETCWHFSGETKQLPGKGLK